VPRIAVELAGESGSLQAAVSRAADSLKGLGDVLAKQTDRALAEGDRTVKMNDVVARSFQRVAAAASSSSKEAAVGYTSSVDEEVAASDRLVGALDRTAVASRESAAVQGRASAESAAAATRGATTHETAARRTERAFGSSSSALTKAGKNISLGLLGAAAASVDLAVKFQANTTRLQTQAGASARQVDLLRRGMLRMAAEVGYTPNQLADGMYHVVSAMNKVLPASQRVSSELHIMRIAAEGAQVGHSNLEETTYALSSALNALHDRGRDAGRVMGQLNSIVGTGDMTMQDLIDSFKSGLIPTARGAGLSLQSVGAALAVMGDMGQRGALAGTRLRMSIALLSSPSAAAAKVLQTLGMSAQQATSTSAAMAAALEKAGLRTTNLSADLHKPDGILVALQDLNEHLRRNGMTATGAAAVMNKAFGGGRMGSTIVELAQNTDRLGKSFTQVGRGASQFGQDWTATTHTASFQLHAMEAQLAALATRIGTDLLPYVEQGVHDISDFVGWLEKGGTAAHALELGIGTLATVAIGSYFTSKVRQAIQLVRDLRTVTMLPFKFGGGGPVSGAGGSPLSSATGGLGIGGSRSGYGLPGSLANPIIVAMEAGEYAGLGSMGAAGTVSTEQKVAQAEAGAVETAGAGTAMRAGGLGTEAEAGLAATLAGGLKTALGGLLKGGLIAGGGVAASQMAGSMIGGKAGHDVSKIGSFASVGAGLGSFFGPEGTVAGGFAGALAGGIATFLNQDATNDGKVFADRFTADLPGRINQRTKDALAKSVTDVANTPKPGSGASMMGPRSPVPGEKWNPKAYDAQFNKAFNDLYNKTWAAGKHAGQTFIQGMQGVKFPSTGLFTKDMSRSLNDVPKAIREKGPQWVAVWRDEAAKEMLIYAQTLQSEGKLPKNAVSQMKRQIEAEFPGLRSYLQQQGLGTARDVANALQMKQAVANTRNLVANLRGQFGNIFQSGKANADNLLSTASRDFTDLKNNMSGLTRQGRVAAQHELDQLKQVANQDLTAMANTAQDKMSGLANSVQSGSQGAATAVYNNFENLQQNIQTAMSNGLVSTQTGAKDISKALNAALKAFGAKPVPFNIAAEASSVQANKPLRSVGASGYQLAGHSAATGGYIGNVGEKGPDSVPIVVGRGEAVLNHSQQQVVNRALTAQGIGGLPEVFSKVTRPHYMARGGYTGYSLPVPRSMMTGGSWSVDQGVDIPGGAGGEPEYAIGPGKIIAEGIGGFGPNAPVLRITSGPLAGRAIYYGHAGPDLVHVGDTVRAGQQISSVGRGIVGLSTGPHIEIGWYPPGAMGAGASMEVVLRQLLGGAGVTGMPGAGGAAAGVSLLKPPHITGTGTIADIVRATMKKATGAANSYLTAHEPASMVGQAGVGGSIFSGKLSGSVEHEVYQFMSAAGFNKTAIAGMIGNAEQESSMNPNAPGGGLWQQVTNFGSGTGGSLLNQMQRMLPQIEGLKGRLNSARSPGEAATIFMNDFEHPAVATENLPRRISAANAAYAAGYGGGGFATDASFPHRVGRSSHPAHHTPHVGKSPHVKGTHMTVKDLQELSRLGGKLSKLQASVTNILGGGSGSGTYANLQSRFSAEEGEAKYLNPDGSTNPAGYAKKISDDQVLLGLLQKALGDYEQELPLVSKGLRRWLGRQSKDEKVIRVDTNRIDANRRKLAANRVKATSIRAAIQALGRPHADPVQTLQDRIARTRLQYQGPLQAAERARSSYHGKDKATRHRLEDAVTIARRNEQEAVSPLESALLNARVDRQRRAQAVKGKEFGLRQQLTAISREDARLQKDDTSLSQSMSKFKGVLSGANGATSTNNVVALMETIAANLGTVEWGAHGVFKGINTKDQGAAYTTETEIIGLQNDISAAKGAKSSAGSTDNSQLVMLLQQQNLQLSEALSLGQAETSVLAGFLPNVRATIPHYEEGGPVLRDTLAMVHEGEHVVPKDGALVIRDGAPATIHVHNHIHGDADGLIKTIRSEIHDPRNVQGVQRVMGQETRMLRGPASWGRRA
jgi:TP901 family phage tail tape measure protein